METERGRRQTQLRNGPSDPQLKLPKWPRGLDFGCYRAVLFLLDPSPGNTQTRPVLIHTYPPSFSFLSLCPNSVADEGIHRPCCTVLSDCPRPRGRKYQSAGLGSSSSTPNLTTAVRIRKPSPIVDPRPGQGPGCSSSKGSSRTAPRRTARRRPRIRSSRNAA